MKYAQPERMSRAEALRVFNEGTRDEICDALVAVALNEPDWRWVQDRCLEFLSHKDSAIRGVAATCVGHVARIHRQVDERVRAALHELAADPQVGARAMDALEDVDMYVAARGE